MQTLASFDVFDTLLTRVVGHPTALFTFLGQELAAAGLLPASVAPAEFARLREAAEHELCTRPGRGRGGWVETTLAAICAELARRLGLPPEAATILAERELDLEGRLLRPVPGAAAMVEAARQEGSPRVLFISDMYLPEAFIQRALERFGFWRPGDGCYVSNVHGCAKRGGGLFRLVLDREQLQPAQLRHTGDNPDGDVRSARRLGIRTRHVTGCHLNRYETLLGQHVPATGGVSALLAGAGRLARLAEDFGSPAQNRLRDVTANVAGPLLASFVGWLLERAAARGLRRLYFVSRDGFVLKELAERMLRPVRAAGGFAPELRYLYGSRQAWHGPAIETLDERECGWIFDPSAVRTVETIFARMGCPPERAEKLLVGWALPRARWAEPLDEPGIDALRERVRGNADLLAILRPLVAEKRALAVRYLRQEGLMDGEPWALVDLGWNGRLQDSLGRLLATEGRDGGATPPLGFYFALKALPAGSTATPATLAQKEAFLFDLRQPDDAPPDIPDMFTLMETFCTAPHGSVTGYRLEDDADDVATVRPTFRENTETALERWGLTTVHATLRRFGDALAEAPLAAASWSACRPVAGALLREFACRPSSAEAAAWGVFPYEDDQAGGNVEPFARPLRLTPATLAHGLREGFLARVSPAVWMGGSKAITPPLTLRVLQGASALGKARRLVHDRTRRWSRRGETSATPTGGGETRNALS